MKKNNIFIYSNTRGFTRFIRAKYANDYEICSFNRYDIESNKISDFLFAFIIIEQVEDLAVFASVYDKAEKIFIVSEFEELNIMLLKLCDVILLKTDMLRSDIIDIIEYHLRQLKLPQN